MNKRDERDKIVQLIYLKTIGGDYNNAEFSKEIEEIVNSVIAYSDEIDGIITKSLVNWTIDRLNYVDKAIIQYAVYEMKYLSLPYEIAINEAIELTKKYSNLDDDLAKRFNNKLLDNIKNILMSE